MTTSFDGIAKLTEQELLEHFASLVARDRRTTAELLVAIAEIDERKIWAAHSCCSMFIFCMEHFHMSEQLTAKRLWAARTARRFPVILEMVARGDLHLGAIHLLAKHLTEENHARVLERAKHRSCREVERLVAELAPRADVASRIRALPGPRGAVAAVDGPSVASAAPVDGASSDENLTSGEQVGGSHLVASPSAGGATLKFRALRDEASMRSDAARGVDNRSAGSEGGQTGWVDNSRVPKTPESRAAAKPIVALSPRRYKIEITVDEATHDKLRSLQDLLVRTETGRDPAAIISRAIDVLLVRTLARKAACTVRPKSATATRTMTSTSAISTKPSGPATKTATAAKSSTSPTPTNPAIRTTRETPDRTDTHSPSTPASDVSGAGRGARRRSISAAVRREVWQRDSGRCCYVGAGGRRCGETSNMEFHHKIPFAQGGLPTTENIELRCAAHNQFQADLDFGRSFMDARRRNVPAPRTFHVECRG